MAYESILADTFTGDKKIIFNAGIETTIDYLEKKNSFSPKVSLIFSPFGLPFMPIEIIGTNINEVITSLEWSKDRNNPGGILQVEIVPDADTLKDISGVIDFVSFNLYSTIWGELGVELEDLFKPMTLCQLWIDGYHVMTGTVRACQRSSSASNTDKSVSYSLTIDELGNLYNLNTLSLDTITLDGLKTTITDAHNKAFEVVAGIKGVSLQAGISAILEAFKLTTLQQVFKLSDGFPLLLRLLSTPNPLGGMANLSFANNMTLDASLFELNSSSSGGQNSVWNFIKNFIPSPWMELFTESGGRTMVTDALGAPSVLFPGFNYVVSRSVPYSNPLIGTVNPLHYASTYPFDLSAISMLIGGDFVIVTDDIIHDKSLGYDCINQNTIFHTRYSSKGAVQATKTTDRPIRSVGPLNPFASGGTGTFGNREMFQNIDTTSLKGFGKAKSYVEEVAMATFGLPTEIMSTAALSNLLAVWFRNQSRFREGSITVKGMPYARAGMYCLYLPAYSGKKVENLRDIGIYYIDSLSHSYSIENDSMSFTTTLNVIRGVPMPATLAQTALLLFDFEVVPPDAGLADGGYTILKGLRDIASAI